MKYTCETIPAKDLKVGDWCPFSKNSEPEDMIRKIVSVQKTDNEGQLRIDYEGCENSTYTLTMEHLEMFKVTDDDVKLLNLGT
jgi:hypothetical protein